MIPPEPEPPVPETFQISYSGEMALSVRLGTHSCTTYPSVLHDGQSAGFRIVSGDTNIMIDTLIRDSDSESNPWIWARNPYGLSIGDTCYVVALPAPDASEQPFAVSMYQKTDTNQFTFVSSATFSYQSSVNDVARAIEEAIADDDFELVSR